MKRIVLSGCDLEVSAIVLGTASLHHLSSAQERRRLVGRALDAGITHFDTAPYYGFGLAESTLDMLAASTATITTKVGLYPPGGADQSRQAVLARKLAGRVIPSLSRPIVDWSVSTARQSLTRSLRRLRRERVDLLLLHEPVHALYASDEWQRWMQDERDRVGAFGVAGESDAIVPFIEADEPVATVIQTRDSERANEANTIRALGRTPVLTFGHLAGRQAGDTVGVVEVLRRSLARWPGTALVVSTRHEARVAELASAGAAT